MVDMAKLSLYIADVSEEFITNVLASVAHATAIRVVGFARDGLTALEQIRALQPNILLTDIQLPDLDGLELLRQVRLLNHPPVCIACTRFYTDVALDAAMQCGASYFLYKPIDYPRLPRIISSCWEFCRVASAKAPAPVTAADRLNNLRLRGLLNEIGFPIRRSGSLYVIESMHRLRNDPMLLRNLSKGLYAELADAFDTTSACIERGLRSAIATAYEHGTLSEVFPSRPSNRVFIQYILETLEADFDRVPPEEHAAPDASVGAHFGL